MPIAHVTDVETLQRTANTIRADIMRMVSTAQSGHPGGSLGMADVFSTLFFGVLEHDPLNPNWAPRDRVIVSNGHISPVIYSTLARIGYFPVSDLAGFRKLGSKLQGHPHRGQVPCIENSGGPLGQGLGIACGLALASKMDGKANHVYALTSDGEHDEGSTWEAVMLAAKYKLNNLVCVIDRNNIQIDGNTTDVMPLGDLKQKYEAFGWKAIDVDGHDIPALLKAFEWAKNVSDAPAVIVAHTIPGKGVSFMEKNFEWHGKAPNAELTAKALAELDKLPHL